MLLGHAISQLAYTICSALRWNRLHLSCFTTTAKVGGVQNLVDEAREIACGARRTPASIDASRAPVFKDEITKRVEAGRTKLVPRSHAGRVH